MVVDTCLPQSFSAAGVSDLMTGELSVVMMMGKWSKNVVDIFRMHDYMWYRHCFSPTMWMLYLDL